MKWNDPSISRAQRDVWAWKDAIYREVWDLPVPEALSAILDKAAAQRTSSKSQHSRKGVKFVQKRAPRRATSNGRGK